ncbi:hypothetical protein LTR53_001228 [Teratosphaeriaceae sp. CCFEE 6253]|nr:hypothetical protein LTR53_001228 [Teratosphaeriaceae sp. CCFEE 6253]
MATASVRATPTLRRARQSHVPDTPASRRTTAGSTIGRPSAVQLPEYEQPTFSLGPSHQRAIAELIARNSSIKKLERHLDEAQSAVTTSAAEINDRLHQGQKAATKRKVPDADAEDVESATVEADVARGLSDLQDKVERMTTRMEESMRKMIDGKRGMESLKESLQATVQDAQTNASTQASTQHVRSQRRPRRESASGSDDEDEDENEIQPFTPTDPSGGTQVQAAPIDVFKKRLEDSKTRYQSLSLSARYAEDHDYSNFKRAVHDAQHPDGDIDVPHPRTWFKDSEPPAPGVTRGAAAGRDEDSDDDIAISRATISIKCPLTLQEFRDPLSSKKCSHSFEASAILEMLRSGKGSVQCPCGGCVETLTKQDLHRDPVLIRKIKRMQRARELEEEDAEVGAEGTQRNATMIEDDEGEDVDRVIERQTQARMKPEPRGSGFGATANHVVDMVGSEEEADEEEEEEEDTTI